MNLKAMPMIVMLAAVAFAPLATATLSAGASADASCHKHDNGDGTYSYYHLNGFAASASASTLDIGFQLNVDGSGTLVVAQADASAWPGDNSISVYNDNYASPFISPSPTYIEASANAYASAPGKVPAQENAHANDAADLLPGGACVEGSGVDPEIPDCLDSQNVQVIGRCVASLIR